MKKYYTMNYLIKINILLKKRHNLEKKTSKRKMILKMNTYLIKMKIMTRMMVKVMSLMMKKTRMMVKVMNLVMMMTTMMMNDVCLFFSYLT